MQWTQLFKDFRKFFVRLHPRGSFVNNSRIVHQSFADLSSIIRQFFVNNSPFWQARSLFSRKTRQIFVRYSPDSRWNPRSFQEELTKWFRQKFANSSRNFSAFVNDLDHFGSGLHIYCNNSLKKISCVYDAFYSRKFHTCCFSRVFAMNEYYLWCNSSQNKAG